MVNLGAKKSFLVCLSLLEKKEFTQYGVKKDLGLGMSVVNSVFKYLEAKKIIAKKDGKYFLVDAVGLCLAVSYFRSMKEKLVFSMQTGLEKKELLGLLPKGAVFCLESAFENYSNYFKTNDACVYLNGADTKKLEKNWFIPGNKATLFVYLEKPKLEEIQLNKKKNCTNLSQTALDLFCDNKAGLGEKLLKLH